jgi:CheY-like chemotaxis protein
MTIDEIIAKLPKRYSIVVVDDNEDDYLLLFGKLKRIIIGDFDIAHYDFPPNFLNEYRENKLNPDIIFIDTNMPRIEGYDLCRRIRDGDDERDGNEDVVIIGMSGDKTNETKWEESGHNSFFYKKRFQRGCNCGMSVQEIIDRYLTK